jgi:hypothetical protein
MRRKDEKSLEEERKKKAEKSKEGGEVALLMGPKRRAAPGAFGVGSRGKGAYANFPAPSRKPLLVGL